MRKVGWGKLSRVGCGLRPGGNVEFKGSGDQVAMAGDKSRQIDVREQRAETTIETINAAQTNDERGDKERLRLKNKREK
jgi:hypothetical protein